MRELQIKRIQAEYGYDRSNAEKIYEIHSMQGTQIVGNTIIASIAAYKVNPFHNAAAENYPLFRKAWMKVPIRLGAFGCAYYVAN